jgi:ATP-dependent helicase/nuclease subunit B
MYAVKRAAEIPRGRLSRSAAEKIYSKRINLTASRVDKYMSCRFSYFLQYGLKAKPRRPALFDPPDIGTFMHYLLENVVREADGMGGLGKTGEDVLRKLTKKYTAQYIESVLDGFKTSRADSDICSAVS